MHEEQERVTSLRIAGLKLAFAEHSGSKKRGGGHWQIEDFLPEGFYPPVEISPEESRNLYLTRAAIMGALKPEDVPEWARVAKEPGKGTRKRGGSRKSR